MRLSLQKSFLDHLMLLKKAFKKIFLVLLKRLPNKRFIGKKMIHEERKEPQDCELNKTSKEIITFLDFKIHAESKLL